MTRYLRIDPLTLSAVASVSDSDREHIINVVRNIVNNVKKKYEGRNDWSGFLNEIADEIIEAINRGWEYYFKYLLCSDGKDNAFCRGVSLDDKLPDEFYFVLIPADTRFPGFSNSIGDHMITTSAFAVSAALSYLDKRCGEIKINNRVLSREEVRGIVRVSALLHDIGKPPPNGHASRTKDIVYDIFKDIDKELAEILSNTASRHHYGQNYRDKPSNVLEWIIAYADKASASSRAFLIRDSPDAFKDFLDLAKDLQSIGYDLGGQEYLNQIENRIYESEEDSEDYRTYGILSTDENKALALAKKLISAEEELCNGEKLLALYHLEVPSIKSYLRRGRELSIYSGYSLLIDSFIHEVSHYIKRSIGKEAVISEEGGSVLAIVPSTFKLNVGEFISKLFGSEKVFDFIRVGKMDFKFAEAHLGPKENWSGWNNVNPYTRDSLRGFGTLLSKFFGGNYTHTLILWNPEPSGRLCEKCKVNPVYEEKVCLPCSLAERFYESYRRMIRGDKEVSDFFRDKLSKLRSYKLIVDLDRILQHGVKVLSTIDEMEKRVGSDEKKFGRDPVLIVADGDNFGNIKSNVTTLTQYIEITRRFTYMIYYSLLYALTRVGEFNSKLFLKPYVELVPILIGGDDISILISAQNLLQFAYYFDEALVKINGRVENEQKYESVSDKIIRKKPYLWFGISAGAFVYTNTAYPLFLAREKAEFLEHISKSESKTRIQRRYKGSGFILSILDNKFIYEGSRVLSILGEEAKDIYNIIRKLEESKISYRKLLDYVKLESDRIRIFYDVARNNKDAAENIIEVIQYADRKSIPLSSYILLLTIMSKIIEKDANQINGKTMKYYEVRWE
ncbi:HD domain-containing protein [Saccharolobus sp. E5-1-F]|uniref:HD domain-containing protein n=1 Tax=Saccharolobus sp. E5-1-F TaxID=2663019 RepID=UPI0013870FD3|nr:HD domain-containing protein [Sulfolobus sp. E5-1-F]